VTWGDGLRERSFRSSALGLELCSLAERLRALGEEAVEGLRLGRQGVGEALGLLLLLQALEEGLRALEGGLRALVERLRALEGRLRALESGLRALVEGLRALEGRLRALVEGLRALEGRLRALEEGLRAGLRER